MTALVYPSNSGCAGAVYGFGGTPSPCRAEPTVTVAHEYRFPRRRRVRLFACDEHAQGEPDPRPLSDS